MMMWLLVLIGAIALIMLARSTGSGQQVTPARRRADAEAAARRWAAVRRVAEEDVTQLGQQVAATPIPADLGEDASREFDDALAAYERAKEALAAAAHPDDLQWVSRSLDDGRFALARLAARQEGRALPMRRPPCFFDQRHGLSVAEASWAPSGGAAREVPVCAACQARLRDGVDPHARMVETSSGQRPYYDAGPEYGPWARGWYAGSGMHVMSGIMMGTLLSNALYLPVGYDYFGSADAAGTDGDSGAGDSGGIDNPDGGSGADGGASDVGGFGDVGGDFGGGVDFGGFDGGF